MEPKQILIKQVHDHQALMEPKQVQFQQIINSYTKNKDPMKNKDHFYMKNQDYMMKEQHH